ARGYGTEDLSEIRVGVAKQLWSIERRKCVFRISDTPCDRPLVEESTDLRDDKIVDAPRLDGHLVLVVPENGVSDFLDGEFLAQTRYDADAFAILRRGNLLYRRLFRLCRLRRPLLGRRRLRHGGGYGAHQQQQCDNGPLHSSSPLAIELRCDFCRKIRRP